MKPWLANALLFQLAWLAAVGGAGRGWAWCGPAAALAFALWQVPRSAWPRADAALVGCVALAGFAVDSLWAWSGLVTYAEAGPWPRLAPAWIVSLWVSFALTLNHSMAVLKPHPAWAALLGAAGGPLAYGVAESAWGAVVLATPPWQPLLALALAWGLLTPALLALGTRLQSLASPRALAVP